MRGRAVDESGGVDEVEYVEAVGKTISFSTKDGEKGLEKVCDDSQGSELEECPYFGISRITFVRGASEQKENDC